MNRIRINTLLLLLCIFLPGVAQDVSITIGPPTMNCLITFL